MRGIITWGLVGLLLAACMPASPLASRSFPVVEMALSSAPEGAPQVVGDGSTEALTPVAEPAAATALPPPAAPAAAAASPPARPAADSRYFAETGFRIGNRYFYKFFRELGGTRNFGPPISRQFRYLGFPAQLFQNRMLLLQLDNSVYVVPLGNSAFFPITQVDGMTLPPVDEALVAQMPQDPQAPDYAIQTIAKVQELVPDEFNGQPVRFLSTYFGSVTYEEAFPLGDQPPEVLPYIAFQLWGRPLSRPTPDPNNPDRIYQRFEYGVMAFDASTGTTTSLPLGAYFKAILTGENLPADLAAAAQGSRFLGQYQPGAPPPALARPNELPDSNFADAFVAEAPPIAWDALNFTYAGAPFRANSPEYGISVFLWGEPGTTARDLEKVRDLGFGWIRQLFQWRNIEGADKGQFDWSEADRIVQAATNAGIKIIARLDYSPEWSQRVPAPNGPPDDLTDFADFVYAFVQRYGPSSTAGVGRVDAIEVWNEPNLTREWGGRPIDQQQAAEYVRMLKLAYQAAKQADPNIVVVSAGLTPTGTQDPAVAQPDDVYLQWMYDAGAAAYFDVLGAHGAGYRAPPEMSPEEVAADPSYGGHPSFSFRRVEQLRDVMVRNGDAEKQIWVLEFGWTSDEVNPAYAWHRVSEQEKADYIVRAFRWAHENWAPWIGVMVLWNLAAPGWTRQNEEYWWSITNPDGSVRPAYEALRAARQSGELP
ncbi:MAG TPA: cellulase family glycosylhydrolase [Chloroflexota bacterium]|nr:cellulase family glycosylhydrolase [Chloroflexota bacterium]